MKICHIALGGCLTAPQVNYGVTEDTGGHINYIIGAATAQARRRDVTEVEIVTRAFDAPALGAIHAQETQHVAPKLSIRRLWGSQRAYLTKEALAEEGPALTDAFLNYLGNCHRRPDIIHAHFADAAKIALAARNMYGIPVVYTPHSLALSKTNAAGATTRIADERRALAQCDATIVSSRNESDIQVTAYGAGLQARVHRISPGVTLANEPDVALARQAVAGVLDDPDRPMILAIARPVRRKNLSVLARIYARSRALQARANLVILAGQHDTATARNTELRDELNAIKNALSDPALQGRVALPPQHAQRMVPALYDFAAKTRGVFCNIAQHEPFGLTVLEAAAAGLPVVATSAGGPQDIIDDLQCGTCVNPDDDAAVATTLLRFVNDSGEWDMAAAAGKNGISRYDWTHWADAANTVYRDTQTQRKPQGQYLLASDIDNTLTGCDAGAQAFSAWVADRHATFAVATGRAITEARRILSDAGLPRPYAMITSVGSEIYLPNPDGRLRLDAGFAAQLETDWDRAAVIQTLEDAEFAFQSPVEQRCWKLSGFGGAATASNLTRVLAKKGLPARVIASHGHLIDVLPRMAGKAQAVAYLARRLRFTAEQVIVAGDSGNDLDMMQAVGPLVGHGIMVGNALPELTDNVKSGQVYQASAHCARGVLEGLAALGIAGARPLFAGAAE